MIIVARYVLSIFFLTSSLIDSFSQERKVVFPLTVVIFNGVDTIYCYEDSLLESSKLIPINTEKEYVDFIDRKIKSIENVDTNLYKPIIRLNAILSEDFGTHSIPWERVFKYDVQTKRNIEFWYRNESLEPEYYSILKRKIKERLN